MLKIIKNNWLIVVLFALFFCSKSIAQSEILQIRSNSLTNKLQIVLEMSKEPIFNAFLLSNPTRVVVDVTAVAARDYKNNLTFKKRGVTLIRTGMHNKNEVRIVLDLNRDYRWEAYILPAEEGKKTRLVIDVFDGEWPNRSTAPITEKIGSIALAKKPIESFVEAPPKSKKTKQINENVSGQVVLESVTLLNPEPNTTKITDVRSKSELPKTKNIALAAPQRRSGSNKPKAIYTKQEKTRAPVAIVGAPKNSSLKETTAKRLSQQDIVVVIDPGHGGKDSGALGKYRTKEKTVVLQIAKRLKKKINAISGMRAILTRNNDRYISLRGRLRLARKHKADLFVSIHADAAVKRSARGSSVYILSNRGASSESARWLAKSENAVDLKYGVDISDYDKDVGNVLMQIQQDATIESSHLLAKKTIRRLKGIGKLHKRNVERAGFAVLKSPDIPSMLVETAFISNPQEEKRLKSSRYQDKIASSIARGIQDYFKDHLPQHLLLIEAGN